MSNIIEETVLETHHWTDHLFTLKLTRDPGFRFESGQFAMIGLKVDGKPLMRAYSMVSASYDEHLEFLSIKVPGGPLTSRLQHVQPGDTILVNRKTTGTLIADNLLPGAKRLYLLSTGTGLAPFLSIIKDPTIYERFDEIILTHTCRHCSELVYQDLITGELLDNEFFGEQVRQKLTYYPSVTREPFKNQGRITELVQNGTLFADLGRPPFNTDEDRVMICGNPHMMSELADILDGMGWKQGNNGEPGHYLIEKAFAEK
ncbi:ferredoxin--NADP reductase [mine drainage metagenome]|uniref:ferredoxin--NADP(+) reductase n=1 Tax=mine drainage metagenome TaxID=410659 RepID=A0A1J5R7Q4_9ZZZZ